MKKEIQPIKELKETVISISGEYLTISTTTVLRGEEKIRTVRVKMGKEEHPLIIAGIKIRLPELNKLRTIIGEENLEDLIKLALNQITPDVKQNLIATLERTEALTKETEKLPQKLEYEVIDLSNIEELVKKLSPIVERVPLDDESKESIKNLAQKLETKKEIRLLPETGEAFKQMVGIVNDLLSLGDLSKITKEDELRKIFQELLEQGTLSGENINYFNKIYGKIEENKINEALKMFITMINSIFSRKKLMLPENIFRAYIRNYVNLCAGYVIYQIHSSRLARDSLKKVLQTWKK